MVYTNTEEAFDATERTLYEMGIIKKNTKILRPWIFTINNPSDYEVLEDYISHDDKVIVEDIVEQPERFKIKNLSESFLNISVVNPDVALQVEKDSLVSRVAFTTNNKLNLNICLLSIDLYTDLASMLYSSLTLLPLLAKHNNLKLGSCFVNIIELTEDVTNLELNFIH